MQFAQPSRQVAPLNIAVRAHQRPTCDQSEQNGLRKPHPPGRAGNRFLEIEQTKIVLSPLADDDTLAPFGDIRDQPLDLPVDLPLEVPGERADPHRPTIFFRPYAGRGQVPKSLSSPRPGLRQHHMRIALDFPRRESRADRAGIIPLSGPLLRVRTEQNSQPGTRFRFRDRVGRRRRQWRRVLPLRQASPYFKGLYGRRARSLAERGHDGGTPGPPLLAHIRRQTAGIAVQQRLPRLLQMPEHGVGKLPQQRDLGLQPFAVHTAIQRVCQSPNRRRGRPGRIHEREEFQQIVRRPRPDTQSPKTGGGVHQQRRRHVPKDCGCLGRRHRQQFPVRSQDGRTAMPNHDCRCGGKLNGAVHRHPLALIGHRRHRVGFRRKFTSDRKFRLPIYPNFPYIFTHDGEPAAKRPSRSHRGAPHIFQVSIKINGPYYQPTALAG